MMSDLNHLIGKAALFLACGARDNELALINARLASEAVPGTIDAVVGQVRKAIETVRAEDAPARSKPDLPLLPGQRAPSLPAGDTLSGYLVGVSADTDDDLWLVHTPCGSAVGVIEPGDTLTTLVALTRVHICKGP